MTGGRSRRRSADAGVDRPNDSQTGLFSRSEPRYAGAEIGTRLPQSHRDHASAPKTLDLDARATIHPCFHDLLPGQRDKNWRGRK